MKKIIIIVAFLAIALVSYCQVPQAFNYQAILRNSDGTAKANESISLQISIINEHGSVSYLEIHNIVTNEFGYANVIVGSGNSSDDLSSLDWANGPYFLEITVNGVAMGSSQLLSVPYALYAASGNEGPQGPAGVPGDTKWAEVSEGINYSEGRVGIGTTEPTEKLDVNGNVNVSGNLTVQGQILAGDKELDLNDILMALGLPANYSGTVVDVGGNSYKTVRIGSQEWFAENLYTWHYGDGSEINRAYNNDEFYSLTNESSDAVIQLKDLNNQVYDEYGLVYNQYAVMGENNLCPDGWHVSSKADWDALVEYLGGSNVAGGKLKEAGYSHWRSCYLGNVPATNESGFTAIPGGFISIESWPQFGIHEIPPGSDWAAWWYGDQMPTRYHILTTCSNESNVALPEGQPIGAPVRCVKD